MYKTRQHRYLSDIHLNVWCKRCYSGVIWLNLYLKTKSIILFSVFALGFALQYVFHKKTIHAFVNLIPEDKAAHSTLCIIMKMFLAIPYFEHKLGQKFNTEQQTSSQ